MKKTSIIVLSFIVLLGVVLRFYKLASNPPSLYWDEVSLGYNAYSILTRGIDEHGEKFPVARFIAFGDYKPPGYIYMTAASITLFGLTEFAVRFPSAFFGTISIVLTYVLVRMLFGRKYEYVGLAAAFFLAISPWHIQLSRGAFEANVAMFFNLAAIIAFLAGVQKNGWYFPLSILLFISAFYTFNANRITAPLILFVLSLLYARSLWQKKFWFIISIVIGIALIAPSIPYLQSRESKLRLQEVSIFNNLKPLTLSNERIAVDGNTFLARIIHNRRLVYAREFIMHFFDHFTTDFLFIRGDHNPRLSVQAVGELYLIELPLLVAGVYFLVKKRSKEALFLGLWTLIIPIPASIAKETPHALRIVSMLPVPHIISGVGLLELWKTLGHHRRLIASVYAVLVVGSMYYYLHYYFIHYPMVWSGEWQYGYKQMVEKVSAMQGQYDHIVVTNSLGRPYIYFLFYQQIDPRFFLATRDADRDWAGLWTVYGFDKYRFNVADAVNLDGRILLVGKPGEVPESARVLDTVQQLNGETIFELAEL